MKNAFWSLALGIGLLSPTITTGAAQAVSLKLLPAVQTVNVGDSLNIDVEISELGDLQSPSLSAFDLNLFFDHTILRFNSFSFGDPSKGDLVGLTENTRTTDLQTSLGLVSFAEVSLDDADKLNNIQPASFILGRANFTAVRVGSSQLTLAVAVDGLLDENTTPLLLTGLPTDVYVTVTSTQVPEQNFSWLVLGLTMSLGTTVLKKKIKF
ncbi:hypothetical protein NIES23_62400 (plasmid) [Trichormus variabilis NIES-23]|uniref:Cohesin domain-containing protein n=1 Tax=Trichormus variabilis NIES-23 TaxID=1973479 RepID=A0A1Z4KWY9_ANAVA|nr:hypothetical protein NIES23_62400 [Trichormus variabilis NIES-23]